MLTLRDEVVVVDGIDVQVLIERRRKPERRANEAFVVDVAVISARQRGVTSLRASIWAGYYFLAMFRQDARLGNREFDERFVVKTSDEALLRWWFDEPMRAAMLSTYDPHAVYPFALTLEHDEGRLETAVELNTAVAGFEVWWRDLPSFTKVPLAITRIDEAIACVAHLAGRGARMAQAQAAAWRGGPDALEVVPPSSWTSGPGGEFGVARGALAAQVDHPWQVEEVRRHGLRTRLRVPVPIGELAMWHDEAPRHRRVVGVGRGVRVGDRWRAAGDWPGLAHTAVAEAMQACGADWLRVHAGLLTVGWERLLDDSAPLGLVLRWLDPIVRAGQVGPYR